MKTFKVLSALLSYPTEALIEAAPEFLAVLDAEKLVPAASRRAVDMLIEEIAIGDVYDLQERYGLLFDRSKTLALHLFEHVHGESRDRGQAMVDLKAMYEDAGLFIAANELPDYVPLLLEFLSTQPLANARELLGQTAHILAALAERLGRREFELQGDLRCAGCDRGRSAPPRYRGRNVEGTGYGPDGSGGARCGLGRGRSEVRSRRAGAGRLWP